MPVGKRQRVALGALVAVVAMSALVGGAVGQIFAVGSYTQQAGGAQGIGQPFSTYWYLMGAATSAASASVPKALTSACTATATDSLASPTQVTLGAIVDICLNSESGGFTSTDEVFDIFLQVATGYSADQEWIFDLYFASPTNSATATIYLETYSATGDSPFTVAIAYDMTHASWTDAYVTDYELQTGVCSAIGTCP